MIFTNLLMKGYDKNEWIKIPNLYYNSWRRKRKVLCDNWKKAIEIYDKLTTKVNEEYGTKYLHYSTWKEEDPEGYIPDYPIEGFACVGIVVYKITDIIDLVEILGCEKYEGWMPLIFFIYGLVKANCARRSQSSGRDFPLYPPLEYFYIEPHSASF